jgi:TetR/AcrR family transcriptional regulator of autoinduction and epiphytic fitness
VWQQFADMETLLIEAIQRDQEVLRSLTERIEPDQPLAPKIAQFTGQRARILEHMAPTWRAARLAEPFSVQLQQNKTLMLAKSQAELELVFAPELATLDKKTRQQLLHSLQAISIWSFWESLRTELGLPPAQARVLFEETFAARLTAAGFR